MQMKRFISSIILAVLLLGASGFASSNVAEAKHRRRAYHSKRYYVNSEGRRVHSPVRAKSAPAGATAECWDGTFSFSRNHRGTCSHHGGVKRWLD